MEDLRKLSIALWTIAAGLGAIIAARWVVGPFRLLGIPVNVPLNPEGIFALIVTILFVFARKSEPRASARGQIPAVATAALALAALFPALRVYFLSDDFILIHQAQAFTTSTLVPLFTTAGGDGFFRPLGYVSFDLNVLVAGGDPRWWHLSALMLHALNSAMVALLAARLGASRWIALLAGTLFALHGTHLEAVVWIAGRFDLLGCLFTLAALLLFGRNTPAALGCALAALWSKEAAYVLPALVTLLAWHERKPLRSSLPYWGITSAAFLYRWILLGGIGGYAGQAGESAFYSLKLATTAKVVFVRVWTSLYFPLNWSREPSLVIGLIAIAYLGALLWLALRARPAAAVRLAFAGLAISILPPLHLLGGAADLSGGRLLYLPSVWFCSMLAFAISGLERRHGIIVTAALLGFHFAALRHDLPFWQRASEQVRYICEAGTQPSELPRSIEGVPALANGFEECRALNSPR